MTKIIWLFETIFLFILSYIIPKKDNLIIFWSRKWEYILGNPKIYYLYLQKLYWNDLELLFFDRNSINTDSRINTFWNSFKKYWYMLRAKYIIIDNFSFDVWHNGVFVWRFNLIQSWHGEPIKWIGFLSDLYLAWRSKIVLFFEKLEYRTYKIILSNKATKKIMSQVFNNSKNVENIWLPRNDLLTHPEIQQLNENQKVKEKILELRAEYRSIYLFTPTFRESTNSIYFTENELEQLNNSLASNNSLLIIKTHPRETRSFLNNKIYSYITNVTHELPYDALDFLPYIDIVITDYSSIYIDFLLTPKPIIWYQNDLDDYINKERWLIYPAEDVVIEKTTAYNFNALIDIFRNIDTITWDASYMSGYNTLKEKFYGSAPIQSSTCEQLTKILFPYWIEWKK